MIDIFSWKRSAAIGPAYSILDQFVSIPKKKKKRTFLEIVNFIEAAANLLFFLSNKLAHVSSVLYEHEVGGTGQLTLK